MTKSTSNAQFQNIFSFSGLFYSWLLEIQTLSFPSPGDLPHPGIESVSPVLQADALLSEPPGLFVNCKIEVNELFLENKPEMEKLLSW